MAGPVGTRCTFLCRFRKTLKITPRNQQLNAPRIRSACGPHPIRIKPLISHETPWLMRKVLTGCTNCAKTGRNRARAKCCTENPLKNNRECGPHARRMAIALESNARERREKNLSKRRGEAATTLKTDGPEGPPPAS